MKTSFQNRCRSSGQYLSNQERPCVCGHFEHTAERVIEDGVRIQPCIASDFDSTISCDCQCYRPSRSKKAVSK